MSQDLLALRKGFRRGNTLGNWRRPLRSLNSPKIDQRIFAGEKIPLGWYNLKLDFSITGMLDIYDFITFIMSGISKGFQTRDIAHVKVLVTAQQIGDKISLVQGPIQVDGVKGGSFMTGEGRLVFNARVLAAPETLRAGIEGVVGKELERSKIEVKKREIAYFVPKPDSPRYSIIAFDHNKSIISV